MGKSHINGDFLASHVGPNGDLPGVSHGSESLARSMNHLQPDVVTYVAVMKSQQKAKLWQNAADMLQVWKGWGVITEVITRWKTNTLRT